MQPVAHSARSNRGIAAQPYASHVRAVRNIGMENVAATLRYQTPPNPALMCLTDWSACFHDLGKLEPDNQSVLTTSEHRPLPVNHVDAGAAYLMSNKLIEPAIAVYSHHLGLSDWPSEYAKQQLAAQDARQSALRDPNIKLETDAKLGSLLDLHLACVPELPAECAVSPPLTGLERRLLLSCLVNADHSDTARNYMEESERPTVPRRWNERLTALDSYVAELSANGQRTRSDQRDALYHSCRFAPINVPIWACESPVGSGKTTSVMAYLLQVAAVLNLRHVFVVLPYTNIIRQSVRTYRKALVLAGEDPEHVVAAHHHQAEFESPDLRHLTTLWEAPIIVTTAVQFFETLGAHQTARLRKLHQLPGSAVFIDEAHAAMPIHIWPYMWSKIKELNRRWSCHFVLASGSLARFWENERLFGREAQTIPSLIPAALRTASSDLERTRVEYKSRKEPVSVNAFCDWLSEFTGPRLVVLNTVQSVAVIARELRRRGVRVLHLSTALAPVHRAPILDSAAEILRSEPEADWVLVATSCVEAGVDLSFRTAFRERSRAASLIQLGGRVNRHGERGKGCVWDFVTDDPLLTQHPDFASTREVVELLFKKDMWGEDPSILMTYALEQEIKLRSSEDKVQALSKNENIGAYPEVSKLTRLISADTRLVVIDAGIAKRIRAGEHVRFQELILHSVQLWAKKIDSLSLSSICARRELYEWSYDYDPEFLGIMEGVLRLKQMLSDGFAVI